MPNFVNVFLPLIHNFMNLFSTLVCLRSHPPPVSRFHVPQRIESVLIILYHMLNTVLTFNLSCVCVQTVRF